MRNADRVVTRTMLLESVWDFHFDPKTNIVETHISRLRSKLSQRGGAELIYTVRGAGRILRHCVRRLGARARRHPILESRIGAAGANDGQDRGRGDVPERGAPSRWV